MTTACLRFLSTPHLVNEFRMAVYKTGYVCWSSQWIFPSYVKQRKDFNLEDGMRDSDLSDSRGNIRREKHAWFAVKAAIWSTGVFFEATKPGRCSYSTTRSEET